MAQESETLGKDSELATTLAQGKPVIAYVPRLRDFEQFKAFAQEVISELYPNHDPQDLLLEFLEIFHPQGAWKDPTVRGWLDSPSSIGLDDALKLIFNEANAMYDRKAQSLLSDHPLGLQIDLERGVANGVLVVRSVAMCAKVLRMVLTRTLEFDVEETDTAYLLRERMTQSIVRVVTWDPHLTNAFWNFYPGVGPSAG